MKNKKQEAEGEEAYGELQVKQSKLGNTIAKVITLLCAVIIWFFAASGENTDSEYTFTNIPVTLKNIPKGMSAFSGTNNVVDVTVVGKRSEVNSLSKDDIGVYVDCSSISSPGRYDLDIHSELKDGISLKALSKDTVFVHISAASSKDMPITVKAVNYTIPPSCTLKTSVTSEPTVTVSGPADELDKISYASVVIYPGNVTSSLTCSGSITLFTADHEEYTSAYVTTSANDAIVKVDLIMTKELALTADTKHGYFNDSTAKLTLTPSSIKVGGDYEILSTMDSLNVYTIDEKSVSDGSEIKVQLDLPDGVKALEQISEITIKVELLDTLDKTLTFPSELIEMRGATLGYDYAFAGDVNISYRIRKNAANYVSASDISVVIDVSDLTQGSAALVATVVLKNENKNAYLLSGTDKNVTVTVTPRESEGELT